MLVTAAMAALLGFAVRVGAQTQHANQSRGFNPQQAYSTHDLDSVNLLNGNLVLSIPIGQRYKVNGNLSYGLTLHYNSNLWNFEEVCPRNIDTSLLFYTTWVYDQFYDIENGQWIVYETPFQDGTDPEPPRVNNPCWTVSYPNPVGTAGLGWQLHFGTLFPPSGLEQDVSQVNPLKTEKSLWVYQTPDGSEHAFYPTLHSTDPAGSPDTGYTRDATYLRMKPVGSERQVEFPSGEVHVFRNLGTEASPDWRAVEYRDRFGNWVRFDYGPTAWVVTDSVGRQHTVHFIRRTNDYQPTISAVELEAFDGGTALYGFGHTVRQIRRAAPHLEGDSGLKPEIQVPFLTSIVLPEDAGSYSMPVETSYDLTGEHSSAKVRGVIRGMTLPTGGRVEWDYRSPDPDDRHGYSFPLFSSSRRYLRHSTGVRQRRVIKGNAVHVWKYDPKLEATPPASAAGKSCLIDTESGKPECAPKEFTNKVTNPQGDFTLHYFSVYPHWIVALGLPQPPRQTTDWNVSEYGLPITKYRQQTDSWGRPVFLSHEVFKAGSTTPLRSVYLRYESGLPQTSDGFGSVGDLHRRVASRRTVFHDDDSDGTRFADLTFDDYDGLGHYRTTHTAGNFEAGSGAAAAARGRVGDLRIDVTRFNPTRGTYEVDITTNSTTGGHTYTPFPESQPWVLGTYDRIVAGDYNKRSVTYFDFGPTGLLRRKRVVSALENTSSVHALRSNDVVIAYNYTNGNLTGESFYGGDKKDRLPTSGELKDITLPADALEYGLTHTYEHGGLKTSRYTGAPFYSVDNDIDLNTGLVKVSRDTAGDHTAYVYDALGRLTAIRPRQGSWTRVVYTALGQPLPPNNAPANAPTVHVYRDPNGGGAPIREDIYQFDPTGLLTFEQRQMPDAGGSSRVFIARVSEYNGMGWLTRVSEWGQPGARTEYSAFDPFGRPHLVTPPDGSGHAIGLRYIGDRVVRRTVKIGSAVANGVVTEQEATTTEIYDRLGRLRSVTEPSGAGGGNVTTSYEYDLHGHLVKATTSGAQATQTREFDYDNRGFLLSEKLPETGVSGNGAVGYGDYDTLGHAGRRVESLTTLRMTYDAAGRLTLVEEELTKNSGYRRLKSFDYYPNNPTNLATSNNYRLGKLQRATRHNWIIHPLSNALVDVEVRDEYVYAGRDGRVSKHTATLNAAAATPPAFEQSFVYDQLGNVSAQTYPRCINANCAGSSGAARALTVNYTYNRGVLTAVAAGADSYASAINYHPNGEIDTITHGNGVSTVHGLDPDHLPRPASVSTAGVLNSQNWNSGTYRYDGAGNVTRVGNDWYVYDKVNRLTEGTALGEAATPLAQRRKQTYTYDAFGNMLGVKTYSNVTPSGATLAEQYSLPTSAATNRRTDLNYDPRGNVKGRPGESVPSYGYDALNAMTNAPGRTFIYNAADERLATIDHQVGTWVETYTLRGLGHEILREYELVGGDALHGWRWAKDYVYRGGRLLATDAPASRLFYHLDHLGTPRLITDLSKRRVAFRQYFPFGAEAVASGQSDAGRLRFTGHERDQHLNGDTLDYMHARTYNPTWGRFLSIDPGRDTDPQTPQSWNSYSYVRGNPVKFNDPDGRATNPVTGQYGIDTKPRRNEFGRIRSNKNNARVGSFGKTRNGGTKPHKGIDINAPVGSPVFAAAGGKVASVKAEADGNAAGNRVAIVDENGNTHRYFHLSAFASDVYPGAAVREGQIIGSVGITGNADASEPHLHYQTEDRRGGLINPVTVLNNPLSPSTSTTPPATPAIPIGQEKPEWILNLDRACSGCNN
jgi:RHS repeat-associated protein